MGILLRILMVIGDLTPAAILLLGKRETYWFMSPSHGKGRDNWNKGLAKLTGFSVSLLLSLSFSDSHLCLSGSFVLSDISSARLDAWRLVSSVLTPPRVPATEEFLLTLSNAEY